MINGHLTEDADGYVIRVVDLYHRTTTAAAETILRTGQFMSLCQNRDDAYFTNQIDGTHSRHYGDAIVQLEVPTAIPIEDERYRDGEVFYRLPLTEAAGRVINAFTMGDDGSHLPLSGNWGDTPIADIPRGLTEPDTLTEMTQRLARTHQTLDTLHEHTDDRAQPDQRPPGISK